MAGADTASFLNQISFKDLQRLRAVVRKVHFRYYPLELQTDREADRIIEAMGPIVAERLIKQAVDSGALN